MEGVENDDDDDADDDDADGDGGDDDDGAFPRIQIWDIDGWRNGGFPT